MKVIITKSFKDKYLKKFKNYFEIKDLVDILLKKEKNFISLHFPFLKFKNKINKVSFRWVIFLFMEEKIVPIFIALKKDKSKWENIFWKKNKDFLKKEFRKSRIDIKNWDFEVFPETF